MQVVLKIISGEAVGILTGQSVGEPSTQVRRYTMIVLHHQFLIMARVR